MNENRTQPEEIDCILKEEDLCGERRTLRIFEELQSNITVQQIRQYASASAYRAAYMKSHNLAGL